MESQVSKLEKMLTIEFWSFTLSGTLLPNLLSVVFNAKGVKEVYKENGILIENADQKKSPWYFTSLLILRKVSL